ncbi:MAG: ShlB/FhaC/HecB family hemolysin secretion/activation protein [Gammaproteobacteria bacterium]|nr:ShlB/FhaC/HecB family hemolysin secretion/activation protein [Gammaproteobacteria bacterium]
MSFSSLAAGQGLPDPSRPSSVEDRAPVLDIPLPEQGAEEEVLKRTTILPKQERQPEENVVDVRAFLVERLMPRESVEGECKEGLSGDFCRIPYEDPELQSLLEKTIKDAGGQFTVFELEEVTVEVTNFFRQQEHILDTAFLPPQQVQDHKVTVQVLQGRLGKVTVVGNKRYKSEVLAAPFGKLIGNPITRDGVTHALLNVWDYPGLRRAERRAQMTFLPGESTGLTDLELEVQEEKRPFNVVLSGDNAGSELSGEYRTRLGVDFNNVTGAADRLSVALIQNFDPKNGNFYAVDYERPVFTPDYKFGIGASRNTFELGQALSALGIEGTTDQGYVFLSRVFNQSFRTSLAASARLTLKDAETDRLGRPFTEDQLTVLDLGVDYLNSDEWLSPKGGTNQSRLIALWSHGFPDFLGSMSADGEADGSRLGAGGEFDKLVVGFTRRQQFYFDTSLWLRLNAQFASDLLVPLEMIALGGPNSVRAFSNAEYLRDKGYFASVEWVTGLPMLKDKMVPDWLTGNRPISWGRALKLSVFADYATGEFNGREISGIDDPITLSGAGVGLGFNTHALSLNMTLATPLVDLDSANGRDPQFFINLGFQFF